MALADFEPIRETILHRGKPLMSVRGLSTDDVGYIVRIYLTDLTQLVERAKLGQQDVFSRLASEHFMLTLLQEAPALVADIICRAADENGAHDKARMLPMPLQLDALMTIVRLTFEDVGGPKVFLAALSLMIQQAQGAPSLETPSAWAASETPTG